MQRGCICSGKQCFAQQKLTAETGFRFESQKMPAKGKKRKTQLHPWDSESGVNSSPSSSSLFLLRHPMPSKWADTYAQSLSSPLFPSCFISSDHLSSHLLTSITELRVISPGKIPLLSLRMFWGRSEKRSNTSLLSTGWNGVKEREGLRRNGRI